MRKFIIERGIAGIGAKSPAELREAAAASNAVLAQLGAAIQWQHSYVTLDSTYCLYLAEEEAVIHEHARLSGFPANRILEVRRMIDPTTAALTRLRATQT